MTDPKDEIVKEFLIESFEALSGISAELTELEKSPEDEELLNSIYRKVHTLKGSASFLGLKKLEGVTHSGENVLDSLRIKDIRINSHIVDTLLLCFDSCLEMLHEVELGNDDGDREFENVKKELDKIYKNEELENVDVSFDRQKLQISNFPITLKDNVPKEIIENQSSIEGEVGKEINLNEKVVDIKSQKESKTEIKNDHQNEILTEKKIDQKVESKTEKKVIKKDSGNESIKAPAKNITDSVVRVNVNLLDKIMNVVGELVLNRNQILQFAGSLDSSELNKLSQQLNVITSELQADIMTTRMQPVGSVLGKFERIVRDLARGQNKKINLEIVGKETELDKTLLEAIKDPLTHLVRNSVDHGVENPKVRSEKGKDEEGCIKIKAYHEGGQVTIEISDDGNGIDPEIILSKAIEKGLVTAENAEVLNEKQILNLIFAPGFSTAEKVTNISGRGVGMDVVKSNIEKIGGSVDVTSLKGQGSTFKLRIPLTLAIVPALVIKEGRETFAIPQINLVELVMIDGDDNENVIEKLHDSEFLRLRGNLIPVFRLNKSLNIAEVQNESEDLSEIHQSVTTNIVILNADGNDYGLVVDEVLDTEEIVVKPLSGKLKSLSLYAGATIMGDGRVALILDALGFFNRVDKSSHVKNDNVKAANTDDNKKDKQEILLCKLSDDRTYGIPLCLVNRLEEFKSSDIEYCGNQALVRYRDFPMPLVHLGELLELNTTTPGAQKDDSSSDSEALPCVVVKARSGYFGLIVKEIRDIAISDENVNQGSVDRSGLMGTMFLGGRTVTLIDVYAVIDKLSLVGVDRLSLSRGKILLVDDSVLFKKMEKELLQDHGFSVISASNGQEGIDLFNGNRDIQLVITDIEMPIMDGLEMAERVKKEKKETPIICITGRIGHEHEERAKEIGVECIIDKSNHEILIEKVKACIGI